ncbi:MAG: PQQ-dependent sugar dehydrogenase [Chloroflexota bacterium]|nr:PQQ-dependent sugar dehydrogenase [Chloroflexota bacterium]
MRDCRMGGGVSLWCAVMVVTMVAPWAISVASAQTPVPSFDPAAFEVGLELVVDGLNQPVYLADPDDGSGRLFVVEQPGTIRIVRDGVVVPEPFLDLTGMVNARGFEQGLLSMALHPEFSENGAFFVGYTANEGEGSGDNTVARYQVAADDPDRADPASAEILLAVSDPFPNHNGGLVKFGPDGYLYVGFGDGGSGGDPEENGQDPHALLGKILRLDIDQVGEDAPYGIPEDNPFADGVDGRPEVWALGLRNPWRFSFDRVTGDLYIGDVGQNQIEEINFQPGDSDGGENYGWNVMEGTACFRSGSCDTEPYLLPIAEYQHEFGCSVTGGYVYRGQAAPALTGAYLFADFCSGLLWGLGRDGAGAWVMSEPIETGLGISSFGENAEGELFVLDLGGGIYEVVGRES